MGSWRLAQAANIELCDTTAMTGNRVFAPLFENVRAYKAGVLNEAEYTGRYLDKMRRSFAEHRPEWDQFRTKEHVALACYCPRGMFCHRHLLVDCLLKWGMRDNIPFKLMGEVHDSNPNYRWRLDEVQRN
jgi:hypothetical protein